MNVNAIEEQFTSTDDKKCSRSKKGMVATAFPLATEAGVQMLELGGNAIDAACASALALCVCEPQACGVFGQSMAIVHLNGRTIGIDGSSRAPSLAHITRISEGEMLNGHKATTVPSTLAVLSYLSFKYGKLDWNEIVAPSINIASKGYKITKLQSRLQQREIDKFLAVPNRLGARYFLDKDKAFQTDSVFKQPELKSVLEDLSKYGIKSFYQGEIAWQIDQDMRHNEGFLRYEDMALIPWPIERQILKRAYRKISVATLPPPAAGRTLLLVLMMLNHLPSKFLRERSAESYHYIAETFRKAFLTRVDRPFDPNSFPQVSMEKRLLTRSYVEGLAKSISKAVDPSLPLIDPQYGDGDTTHLSVMDKDGNAVGITQSIERVYGSHAAAEGLGFLFNNYMSAFETKDPSHPYFLRPNGVPWTSVAPCIVFRKKKPWIIVGSPGSERIFSSVAQFLSAVVDRNLPICEAMREARMHCSIGGKLSLEAGRFPRDVLAYLKETGYRISEKEDYSFYLGAIHAVMRTEKDEFLGVAEIRRDGTAGGPQ